MLHTKRHHVLSDLKSHQEAVYNKSEKPYKVPDLCFKSIKNTIIDHPCMRGHSAMTPKRRLCSQFLAGHTSADDI